MLSRSSVNDLSLTSIIVGKASLSKENMESSSPESLLHPGDYFLQFWDFHFLRLGDPISEQLIVEWYYLISGTP